MAVLGGMMSIHPPQELPWKLWYGFVFMCLGFVGIRLVIQQSDETASSNFTFVSTLANIANSTRETTRMQILNTELQERLLSQGKTIADLGTQGINTATGGDSFCYMAFNGDSDVPVFVHQGKYPLYGVVARIVDPNDPQQVVNPLLQIIIGPQDISAGLAWIDWQQHIPFRNQSKQDFNVFFSAKNGVWTEQFRLRRINGKSERAILVEGRPGMNIPFARHKLFEQISPGFPQSELDATWGKTPKHSSQVP
jgi:hypothetical protein